MLWESTQRASKNVLGILIGEDESSKFWLKVLTDLSNRGVKEVIIFSVDGLSGFKQAILVTFPKATVQRCIIYHIRSSTRYVSYKDIKSLMADLKSVYQAPNEKDAYKNLGLFKKNRNNSYLTCVH